MVRSVLVVCLLVNFVLHSDSYRILVVVPTPSISHQVVFRPLAQELARRGHEVVYITTDPIPEEIANLTQIDFHDISYKTWIEEVISIDKDNKNHVDLMKKFIDVLAKVFEQQLKSDEFQKLIHGGKKFDLLILEACVRPTLGLVHVFKAPVILMSSLGPSMDSYEIMGAPTHPLLYPAPLQRRLYNLTMWEKLIALYYHYSVYFYFNTCLPEDDAMLRRILGPDFPSLVQLQNKVDMFFNYVHPILEGNVPVPPGVVHIWGMHKKPEKELPKDLKSYLDASKHGVIYISFGTNVDPTLLSPEKIQLFSKVFASLPYDVLWKWNGDELQGKPDNVRIGKWFPQSDLLRHPKIKLFITQGGLQSTDEAIQARVPLVGVPMLGDQWYNTEKYVHLGIGVKLDFQTITEDIIKEAIDTVINDRSYKTNIEKLDALIRDEPMNGLERAVWWTEYVLRHGGAQHLRAPAANMSWFEYLELELVFTVLLGLFTVILLCVIVIRALVKYLSKLFVVKVKSQ